MNNRFTSDNVPPPNNLKKILIIGSTATLLVVLGISTFVVQRVQKSDTQAMLEDRIAQCPYLVTDSLSCSRDGGEIINTVDASGSGDGTTILVCCRLAPSPTPFACPEDSILLPTDQCLPENIIPIEPIEPPTDGGDIQPGMVCCRPKSSPTPPELEGPTDTPTPTPLVCKEPPPPNITNLNITCPECVP